MKCKVVTYSNIKYNKEHQGTAHTLASEIVSSITGDANDLQIGSLQIFSLHNAVRKNGKICPCNVDLVILCNRDKVSSLLLLPFPSILTQTSSKAFET